VAELPLQMQVKLLRAIQEKSVRAVGAANEEPVDVRILSATHKDLAELVEDGRFRHDLYYRINVIELKVPPLRERRQDLPELAAAVLARLARSHGRATPLLAPSALEALAQYAFPGNVRELENILERALALAEEDRIGADDLRLPQHAPRAPGSAAPPKPWPTCSRQRRPALVHRAARAQRHPARAGREPLEQDPHRRAAGHHLPRAALQAEEAGDGVRPGPTRPHHHADQW
jgi:transcriptional regulator with PAS, ATPase and Fis domain